MPAIEVRASPLREQQQRDEWKQAEDQMPSANTAEKHTFARGSRNTVRVAAAGMPRDVRSGKRVRARRCAQRDHGGDKRDAAGPRQTRRTPCASLARSPMMPASVAPSRSPVMTAVSQRPIATWRSFIGMRSPITAMPTGKMPSAAGMPATMRAPSSTV